MNLTGTYKASMHTPIGEKEFVLVLDASNPKHLKGTFTGDHGTCEILWGAVIDRPEDNPGVPMNTRREGGENTGTYIFFNIVPHDCDLTFFAVVQESGAFYGANFHKNHSSLFSGEKTA